MRQSKAISKQDSQAKYDEPVKQALQTVWYAANQICSKRLVPFPLLGLDTDNGSEFINQEMINYCESGNITFTRGRAYRKSDQA